MKHLRSALVVVAVAAVLAGCGGDTLDRAKEDGLDAAYEYCVAQEELQDAIDGTGHPENC